MKQIKLPVAASALTILMTCFATGLCRAQTREERIDGEISIVNANMQLLTPKDDDFGWCVGNHFTLSIRVEQSGDRQKVVARFTWHAIEHDKNNCDQIEPDLKKRSELVGSNESSMWTAAPGETVKLPPDSEEFVYDWTQNREHFDEQNIVPSKGPIEHINFLLLRQFFLSDCASAPPPCAPSPGPNPRFLGSLDEDLKF